VLQTAALGISVPSPGAYDRFGPFAGQRSRQLRRMSALGPTAFESGAAQLGAPSQ